VAPLYRHAVEVNHSMQHSIQEEEMKNEISIAHLERPLVNESSIAKARKLTVRVFKVLLIVVVSLVALFLVAQFIWRYSGSNQWEFVHEKNGVKIYTLKAPGVGRIQIKGVVQVRSTLSHIVRYNQDPEICKNTGCIESRMIDRVDDQLQYYTFRYNFPYYYKPREYVIRAQFHQDPRNKEVLLVFSAAPDKLPPNSCCFRVTDMYNTFRFTPLENGLVEIEYVRNMSEGLFTPDWWVDRETIEHMTYMLSRLPDRLDKRKYQDEKFDFIKEK